MGEILSTLVGAVAVALLAAIARQVRRGFREIRRVSRNFDRFMLEHTWLLATSLWTRDKVLVVMRQLDIPVEQPPPADLPPRPPRR